jgi:hypothetical protein
MARQNKQEVTTVRAEKGLVEVRAAEAAQVEGAPAERPPIEVAAAKLRAQGHTTMSAQVRELFAMGYKVAEIAKFLDRPYRQIFGTLHRKEYLARRKAKKEAIIAAAQEPEVDENDENDEVDENDENDED